MISEMFLKSCCDIEIYCRTNALTIFNIFAVKSDTAANIFEIFFSLK